MAITILRHGNRMKRTVCPYCGCVFIHTIDDFEFGVKCPECKSEIPQEYSITVTVTNAEVKNT